VAGREQDPLARMRDVELYVLRFDHERLSERSAPERQAARVYTERRAQMVSRSSARSDEAIRVRLKAEPTGARALVVRNQWCPNEPVGDANTVRSGF
jgi:hypothetical protein